MDLFSFCTVCPTAVLISLWVVLVLTASQELHCLINHIPANADITTSLTPGRVETGKGGWGEPRNEGYLFSSVGDGRIYL